MRTSATAPGVVCGRNLVQVVKDGADPAAAAAKHGLD